MKGLDGLQGPFYVGTGCVFRRQALYGNQPPKVHKRPKMGTCGCLFSIFRIRKNHQKNFNVTVNGEANDKDKEVLLSQMDFDQRFGKSSAFVTSTLREEGGVSASSNREDLLKEAIHILSCDYEDRTQWGTEVSNNVFRIFAYLCFWSLSVTWFLCRWVGYTVPLQKTS